LLVLFCADSDRAQLPEKPQPETRLAFSPYQILAEGFTSFTPSVNFYHFPSSF
jgi:hypothetical protein